MKRLEQLNYQFGGDSRVLVSEEKIEIDGKSYAQIVDNHSDREIKFNYFNLQGWGYKDSGFEFVQDVRKIQIKGNRYMFGGQYLPKFASYVQEHLHIDLDKQDPAQSDMEVAPPTINHAFIEELGIE